MNILIMGVTGGRSYKSVGWGMHGSFRCCRSAPCKNVQIIQIRENYLCVFCSDLMCPTCEGGERNRKGMGKRVYVFGVDSRLQRIGMIGYYCSEE